MSITFLINSLRNWIFFRRKVELLFLCYHFNLVRFVFLNYQRFRRTNTPLTIIRNLSTYKTFNRKWLNQLCYTVHSSAASRRFLKKRLVFRTVDLSATNSPDSTIIFTRFLKQLLIFDDLSFFVLNSKITGWSKLEESDQYVEL